MHNINQRHQVNCYSCHKPTGLENMDKVLRSDSCPECGCDLRCCKMCHFYSESSYNECKEPVADRIVEKEKANFCSYYILDGQSQEQDTKSVVDAANALFKD